MCTQRLAHWFTLSLQSAQHWLIPVYNDIFPSFIDEKLRKHWHVFEAIPMFMTPEGNLGSIVQWQIQV